MERQRQTFTTLSQNLIDVYLDEDIIFKKANNTELNHSFSAKFWPKRAIEAHQ